MNNKIGAILPTFGRPDFARFAALQMLNQSRTPDVICIHQNGSKRRYDWCLSDIDDDRLVWMHTPEKLHQADWYLIPLKFLMAEECTHFLWIDHDDIYLKNHIEVCLNELSLGFDFRISNHCGLLLQGEKKYKYHDNQPFKAHMGIGMSSSMCFTRKFATALASDLENYREKVHYADNILSRYTLSKFSAYFSNAVTTTYVSHAGSNSSHHWVKDL